MRMGLVHPHSPFGNGDFVGGPNITPGGGSNVTNGRVGGNGSDGGIISTDGCDVGPPTSPGSNEGPDGSGPITSLGDGAGFLGRSFGLPPAPCALRPVRTRLGIDG